jgi:5,10-methylenetetrahydromethanopterin reductase
LGGERLTLGLGAGVGAFIERMGLDYRNPLAAVTDTAVIVQHLLAGEVCTHDGAVHRARGLKFDFTPPAVRLPLYLGVMGPKALRLAGRLGDGVLLTLMTSIPYVRHALAEVRAGAAEAGRSGHALGVAAYFPFSVGPDGAPARAALKPMMARVFARWRGKPALERMFTEFAGITTGQLDAIIQGVQAGGRPEDLVPDEVVDVLAVAGTPQECLARLSALRAAGVDEAVVAASKGPGGASALIRAVSEHLMSGEMT